MAMGVGGAFADNIFNNLDGTIDAAAEIMALNVDGATGTTTLALTEANGDGKNGCNLTGSTELKLAVNSSNPAVATVSPGTVTFTSCGFTKALSVLPLAKGSTTITLSEISNDTGASFDLGPATFQVNVTAPAPANSAPKVVITGVAQAAQYLKGAVPSAICEVTDIEDGVSSFPADLSAITGPYAVDGIGSQTASCSYTDQGGLTDSSSATYFIADGSAPGISYILTPAIADGENGWYRSDVSLKWSVSEPESPSSLVLTGCDDQNVTADQQDTAYSCSATSAGGAAVTQTVNIKRDATAPTVVNGVVPLADGENGWHVHPVTATFSVSDATSGVSNATATADSQGAEGGSVVLDSPAVTDLAGNVAPAGSASQSFKIDLSDPTATLDSSFADAYYFGEVPTAPTCSAHDAVSGPAGCVVSGYSSAVGTHTLTATAKDIAGRTGTATPLTYTVKAWTLSGFYQPVDMGGVLNTVKAGSTVPLKFEMFRGATEIADTAAVKSFTTAKTDCAATAPTDDIEVVTTGGTTLRYDSVAGQFVQNWQTPKAPGTCYRTTMTAQDGSTIVAFFKLK
jgi:hypothetical protein